MENTIFGREILDKIYKYYPKDCAFESLKYQKSEEYIRLLKKREDACNSKDYQDFLMEQLDNIFSGYKVVNWSDLNSSNCHEFRILLHQDQSILDDDEILMRVIGNERFDLMVFISIIEKYYYIHSNCTRYVPETNEWSFCTMDKLLPEIEDKVDKLKHFLKNEKYAELSELLIKTIVPDIETELEEVGDVNVFDCIFTDLIKV